VNRVGGSYIRGERGWEQMHSASFRLIRQTVTRARDIGEYFVHFASLTPRTLTLPPRLHRFNPTLYSDLRRDCIADRHSVNISVNQTF